MCRRVRRYADDGQLDLVVEVPASRVTACTLGGENLDQLFITTSRLRLADGAEPLAGAVFSCPVAVSGLPVRPYLG
ncbi:MAG: SMP-30/gluconolactonase/LRE family protein [Actinomycetota bacterium]